MRSWNVLNLEAKDSEKELGGSAEEPLGHLEERL